MDKDKIILKNYTPSFITLDKEFYKERKMYSQIMAELHKKIDQEEEKIIRSRLRDLGFADLSETKDPEDLKKISYCYQFGWKCYFLPGSDHPFLRTKIASDPAELATGKMSLIIEYL